MGMQPQLYIAACSDSQERFQIRIQYVFFNVDLLLSSIEATSRIKYDCPAAAGVSLSEEDGHGRDGHRHGRSVAERSASAAKDILY